MDLKEQEKKRTLTENEQARLEKFEDNCYDLEQQGYRKTELTVSIIKANMFALLFSIPVFVIGIGLFVWRYGFSGLGPMTVREIFITLIGFVVLTILHEFIHGFTWGLYAEHYFQDIEFGFMKAYLTPYCTCTVPLNKKQYIIGTLMPLIVLGILPVISALVNGNYITLFLGLMMTVAASGDILIAHEILNYRTEATDVMYIDHPTMAGGVIFER